MKVLVKILVLNLWAMLATAQTNEQAIKHSIDTFFMGMESNDTTLIAKTIDHEGASLKSIVHKKDGSTAIQSERMGEFYKQVLAAKGLKLKEQLLSYEIKIDGAMAIAWTPYRFLVNDKLSHCGVDVFTLINRQNEWKIISIVDTRRKLGCE